MEGVNRKVCSAFHVNIQPSLVAAIRFMRQPSLCYPYAICTEFLLTVLIGTIPIITLSHSCGTRQLK